MNTEEIIAGIDAEIGRLVEVKRLLGEGALIQVRSKSGPKPRAVNAKKKAGKRIMSAEGRARIAAAQKARWAKAKKTAA